MRTRLTVSFLVVLVFLITRSASLGVPPAPKTLVLTWSYPQMSTSLVFKVYSSTNLAVPIRKWPVYTNVTTRSCPVQIDSGSRFFAVTASNKTLRTESAYLASARLAVVLPPQPKTVTLKWNYPQLTPDIVFKVYSSTNLAMPLSKWPIYTNLTTTSCVVQVFPGNRFFTVSASNTTTRTESRFSR
jgi:hypothetical protein